VFARGGMGAWAITGVAPSAAAWAASPTGCVVAEYSCPPGPEATAGAPGGAGGGSGLRARSGGGQSRSPADVADTAARARTGCGRCDPCRSTR